MKCRKCGAKWKIGNQQNHIKRCPICEIDFEKDGDCRIYEDIEELLITLLYTEGVELLNDLKRINAYLSDYFPQKIQIRQDINSLMTEGLNVILYNSIISKSEDDKLKSFISSHIVASISVNKLYKVSKLLCGIDKVQGSNTKKASFYIEQLENLVSDDFRILALEKAKEYSEDVEIKNKILQLKLKKGDFDGGIQYLQNLIDSGNTKAMIKLAQIKNEESGKLKETFDLLKKAVELGDDEAMCILADMYRKKNDLINAEKYYKKSAENNNTYALCNMYKIKFAEKKDEKVAIEYLKKAAELKYVPAMYEYAIYLLYGDIVEENIEQAIKYLDECAEKGDLDAIQKLIYMYSTGYKVKKDLVKVNQYKIKLEI